MTDLHTSPLTQRRRIRSCGHQQSTKCTGRSPPAVLPCCTSGTRLAPACSLSCVLPAVCSWRAAHAWFICAHLPAPPGTRHAPGAAAFAASLPPAVRQPGALHAGAPALGHLTSHLCRCPGLAAAVWLHSLHPAAPAAPQANSVNPQTCCCEGAACSASCCTCRAEHTLKMPRPSGHFLQHTCRSSALQRCCRSGAAHLVEVHTAHQMSCSG